MPIVSTGTMSYTASLGEADVNVSIGNYSSIGQNITVMMGQHSSILNRKYVSNFPFGTFDETSRNAGYIQSAHKQPSDIHILNDVWIGNDCLIAPGVTIGNGAIIGQRSIVTRDVNDYAVVVGAPAISKKYRFPIWTIQALLDIKWWNWPMELIRERIHDFKDIDVFVEKYHNTDPSQ